MTVQSERFGGEVVRRLCVLLFVASMATFTTGTGASAHVEFPCQPPPMSATPILDQHRPTALKFGSAIVLYYLPSAFTTYGTGERAGGPGDSFFIEVFSSDGQAERLDIWSRPQDGIMASEISYDLDQMRRDTHNQVALELSLEQAWLAIAVIETIKSERELAHAGCVAYYNLLFDRIDLSVSGQSLRGIWDSSLELCSMETVGCQRLRMDKETCKPARTSTAIAPSPSIDITIHGSGYLGYSHVLSLHVVNRSSECQEVRFEPGSVVGWQGRWGTLLALTIDAIGIAVPPGESRSVTMPAMSIEPANWVPSHGDRVFVLGIADDPAVLAVVDEIASATEYADDDRSRLVAAVESLNAEPSDSTGATSGIPAIGVLLAATAATSLLWLRSKIR